MADPRSTATNRIGTSPVVNTYKIDNSDITYDGTKLGGSSQVGLAVMESAAGVVRLTADAVRVLGKLIKVNDDGYCSVLVGGVTTLPSSGTITVNTEIVGALNAAARGYIRSAVLATLADVSNGGHFVIDATDAANVEVQLG